LRTQLEEVRKFLISYYRQHYTVPIEYFRIRSMRSLFWCAAGQDRLALAADGKLWGCRFFADFFADKLGHPEYDKFCCLVLSNISGEIKEGISGK
jgi:hypothetical protein